MTTVTVILNFIIQYFYDALFESHENVECKIYGCRVVVIFLFSWYYQRYAHAVR